jgi:hypothetical protein
MRQMALAQSVTDIIIIITREEEVLSVNLEMLAKKHINDVSKITCYNTHWHIIMEDIENLDDMLVALWTETVYIRHSLFLSARLVSSR